MAELGSGVVLYFHFLALLAIVFLLISLAQIPALVVYGQSNDLKGRRAWPSGAHGPIKALGWDTRRRESHSDSQHGAARGPSLRFRSSRFLRRPRAASASQLRSGGFAQRRARQWRVAGSRPRPDSPQLLSKGIFGGALNMGPGGMSRVGVHIRIKRCACQLPMGCLSVRPRRRPGS